MERASSASEAVDNRVDSPVDTSPDTDALSLRAAIRRSWWMIVVGVLIGAVAGAGVDRTVDQDSSSSVNVLVTPITESATNNHTPKIDLDNEAALVRADVTLRVASQAMGGTTTAAIRKRLTVGAVAGSTVLTLTYAAPTGKGATTGATAVAHAYLDGRAAAARSSLDAQLRALDRRLAALNDQIAELSGQLAPLRPNAKGITPAQANAIAKQRNELQAKLQAATQTVTRLTASRNEIERTQVHAGRIISGPSTPKHGGAPTGLTLVAAMVIGAVIGLFAALARARTRAEHAPQRFARQFGADVVTVTGSGDPDRARDLYARLGVREERVVALAPISDAVEGATAELVDAIAQLSRDAGNRTVIVTTRAERGGDPVSVAELAATATAGHDATVVRLDTDDAALLGAGLVHALDKLRTDGWAVVVEIEAIRGESASRLVAREVDATAIVAGGRVERSAATFTARAIDERTDVAALVVTV